jgi:hypothetical protein
MEKFTSAQLFSCAKESTGRGFERFLLGRHMAKNTLPLCLFILIGPTAYKPDRHSSRTLLCSEQLFGPSPSPAS